ncbi:MAG TPA: hypothetical protein DCQ25_00110 [Elusimicrobia bacterium]|nr:hypothetical protein [Elusimicrobiota bacterium]
MRAGGTRRGFGLVEAMMAIFLLAILGLSLAYMLQYLAVVSVKTRENSYTSRVASAIFAKFKTMEYYYVFDADSALPGYGISGTFGPVTLQKAAYPYLGLLREATRLASRYSVDRWTLDVKFKLRDVSDANGNGLFSDLRDFVDSDGNGRDDYDEGVRYFKANSDADYFDTYVSTALDKTASELPDTNMKEVTLKLYRRGRVIHTQTDLISLEMLSGIESRSSGADLKMFVNQPANDTCLYDLSDPARAASFALPLFRTYPAEVAAYRADSTHFLRLWGETVPLASVKFHVNSMTAVADTLQADASGGFDLQSLAVTNALQEGENTIYAQATKDTYYSPYAPRRVTRDLNPPAISAQAPSGAVADLMPYVGAVLADAPLFSGTPCGICREVIMMRVNGAEVPYEYSASDGRIRWTDPATGLPAKLADGSEYTVYLEGGDNAYYKVNSTWTFTVSVGAEDHSAPSVANKTPLGASAPAQPEISCRLFDNQSGIDPFSITLRVDGGVAVSSANIASCWDAESGTVSYTPPSSFQPGSAHTAEITVSHWADSPADKKTSVESWGFTVED